MSWVYRMQASSVTRVTPSGPVKDERIVYAVGFLVVSKWETTFTCDLESDARIWCHYLNGGAAPNGMEPE